MIMNFINDIQEYVFNCFELNVILFFFFLRAIGFFDKFLNENGFMDRVYKWAIALLILVEYVGLITHFETDLLEVFSFGHRGAHLSLAVEITKALLLYFWLFYYYYLENNQPSFIKDHVRVCAMELALAGGLIMISATNWIHLIVGTEIISFSTYFLIAHEGNKQAVAAAFKYIVYSVLGTSLILFGFVSSYVSYKDLFFTPWTSTWLFSSSYSLFFWIVGWFIKIGIGPSFFWVPEVYRSTSAPIFLYVSTIIKIPYLFPLLQTRVVPFTIGYEHTTTTNIIIILGLIGIVINAVIIFNVKNIRDLIAYSSGITMNLAVIGFAAHFSAVYLYVIITTYLAGHFAFFIWHTIINANELSDVEVVEYKVVLKGDRVASAGIITLLVANSGLPPVVLFIYKFVAIGMFAGIVNPVLSGLGIFIMMGATIVNIYAYFRLLATLEVRTDYFFLTPAEGKITTYEFAYIATFLFFTSLPLITLYVIINS
jgi:NADH:ubiquinone oxidoreductase subunit 2 (subunit N)